MEEFGIGSCSFDSGWNKIGDRGNQYICGGDWPRIKIVWIGIYINSSGDCGVREEGCRSMAKHQGCLKVLNCIIVVNQVLTTESEWSALASLGELL